jgi:hypothetical protein
MNVSVPSWPEAAGPRESLQGKSPLKMPQGDHTFATFACKHSEKQPFADETVSLEAAHPVCPEGNWHGRQRERPAFQGFLTAKYRGACSLTWACPG